MPPLKKPKAKAKASQQKYTVIDLPDGVQKPDSDEDDDQDDGAEGEEEEEESVGEGSESSSDDPENLKDGEHVATDSAPEDGLASPSEVAPVGSAGVDAAKLAPTGAPWEVDDDQRAASASVMASIRARQAPRLRGMPASGASVQKLTGTLCNCTVCLKNSEDRWA
jgi:hypothetical protein